MALDAPTWWTSLRHGGLLIAPSRLAEHFPDAPPPLPQQSAEDLRRSLLRLDAAGMEARAAVLDSVLHRVCCLEADDQARWERGADVDGRWSLRALSGEAVRPRRVWYGPHGTVLPVFWDDAARLGIGTGRRGAARVVHWLRQANLKLALLTNARQWRLIFVGLDFDAWAEWDSALWFEEGQPGPQVDALRVLLTPSALAPPRPDALGPLLAAIQASRRGQAELSAELGERVRQAVELLIQTHGPRLQALDAAVAPRDIYVAATRVVMRMVVALFAEARDLLPRDNAIYHGSYGVQGLREQLERAGGASDTGRARLRERHGAWPRVLALFRLVHSGSHHEQLPVPSYGGELFAPGDAASPEPMRRALAVFEDAADDHTPSDAVVFQLLVLLCRSRVRVQQGKGSTWVDTPVDFSDLSSEYLGILYEGLLDYELRPAAEPMVFLALGDEPLLPLSRLEAMTDDAIQPLVEKLKKKAKAVADAEEEEELEDDEEEAEDAGDEAVAGPEEDAAEPESDDARAAARAQAHAWARRAVIAGKLIGKPKSKKAAALAEHEREVDGAARALIRRVVLPGEWYLVRWGGTRKGAGTFYTRPQLAVPTVQRSLRPLAYQPPLSAGGAPDEDAPAARWTPQIPEHILALKVCDPAVGSGSFLIGSLRFLTDALLASLHHHHRIQDRGDGAVVRLADGQASARIEDELLPCRPDAEDFEPRLRARLKRYIVERCLYGVDIDPLAAELARLALWIETMDRELPFEFLDHKVKVGNSLVGCWFDRFRDYPALAWEREGGDKVHGTSVHHSAGTWTNAIKEFRDARIKPELVSWIGRQSSLLDTIDGRPAESLHDDALGVFHRIHAVPVHDPDVRARLYTDEIGKNPALLRLRRAFDAWCAVWFWPPLSLESAPSPRTFEELTELTLEGVAALRREHQFFHWELEFPDVFSRPGTGFDAIVGNPPWETLQPNSKEFFSNHDPLYRALGKQDALRRQKELFAESEALERAWLSYNARYRALSNWFKRTAEPFDESAPGKAFLGKAKADLHRVWRGRRSGHASYADPEHPFAHQGEGKAYTYRIFLEQAHCLLRPGGQIGFVVPAGIYTDKGSADLRTLFLERCRWRWLFGFENREKVFNIDSRFKFGPVIIEKGRSTDSIRTAFMRRDLADWETAEAHAMPYPRRQVERFSPKTRILVELQTPAQAIAAGHLYSLSQPLSADLSDSELALESTAQGDLNLTSGVKKVLHATSLPPELSLNRYGQLTSGPSIAALPVYQGAMIHQFNPFFGAYESGFGHQTKWQEAGWAAGRAQFFLPALAASTILHGGARLVTRRLINSTNERSMIAAIIPPCPSSDTTLVLQLRRPTLRNQMRLCACLNSFVFDWCVRSRVAGATGATALDLGRLEELPIPGDWSASGTLIESCARLNLVGWAFAPEWLRLRGLVGGVSFARSPAERLRLRCIVDALVSSLYAIDEPALRLILADCDWPVAASGSVAFTRQLDQKGFWRVDKEKDPELRHPVLALVAFHDLQEHIAAAGGDRHRGIESFCKQNDGEGWMLPETLRLADYGLGHDERAEHPQPVRTRLGPRFFDWQLGQSVEESWAECELHARNLLGEEAFARLRAELRGEPVPAARETPLAAEGRSPYGGAQKRLFPGERTLFGDSMEDPEGLIKPGRK